MDQITDLSMPAPSESGAHLAHAANPTSHVPNHNHPPYADMIFAAISALKDKDGSSRQAIAKYIEQVFPNLPPSHSSLLTTHLKRLKNNGQLVMIKHSYALPGSENFSFAAGEFSPPAPAPAASNTVPSANAPYSGSKRKPGRPPKSQFQQPTSIPVSGAESGYEAEPQAYSVAAPGYQPEYQPYPVAAPGFGHDVQGYQAGAPGFGSDVQPYPAVGTEQGHDIQPYPVGGPEPMFVSLGLDDGPVVAPPSVAVSTPVNKRGRGRPPKGTTNGPVVPEAVSGGPTVLGKRASGRPIKPRSITEIMSNGGLKPKKARGRPRVAEPVVVPLAGGSPRPPKKGPVYSGRPRGRPPKNGAALAATGGVVPARRSGRPARIGVARKLSGKPMGRPRKISAPVTGVLVTDPQQLVAYQDLKSKYEHIKLKVKQTACVLRPCLNHEGAISALGALQELEALATTVEVNNAQESQEPPTQLLRDHQENLF